MAALAGYLQAVRREYDKQDGEQLRGLMELDGPRSGLAAAGEAARSRADLLQLCGRALQPPLDEVRRTFSLVVSQPSPASASLLQSKPCSERHVDAYKDGTSQTPRVGAHTHCHCTLCSPQMARRRYRRKTKTKGYSPSLGW